MDEKALRESGPANGGAIDALFLMFPAASTEQLLRLLDNPQLINRILKGWQPVLRWRLINVPRANPVEAIQRAILHRLDARRYTSSLRYLLYAEPAERDSNYKPDE